jgi:tRNA dimethylallyltransferase
MTDIPMITIVGPTACGKTRLAVDVALAYDTEVISADSRQFYRGMTLGTGKDLDDYVVRDEQGNIVGEVPYHLIDIREPGYKYSIYEYQSDFHRVYDDMVARGKIPVLCGGSGLYVESVLRGYEMHEVPENPELRRQLEGKSLAELEAILKTYKTLHNTTDTDTVNEWTEILLVNNLNLLILVRSTETIEEVEEWNTAGESSEVCYS